MRTPGNPLDRERVSIELERRGDDWLAHVSCSPDGLRALEDTGPELRGSLRRVLDQVGDRLHGREAERLSAPIEAALDTARAA